MYINTTRRGCGEKPSLHADLPPDSLAGHIGDFLGMLREGVGAGQGSRGVPVGPGVHSNFRTTFAQCPALAPMGTTHLADETALAPTREVVGSRPGPRNGGGPPGDDGDDDDDHGGGDEPAAEDAELSPEERKQEASIQRAVQAAVDLVVNSPEIRELLEAQHQLAMTRNSALLEQQSKIAALVLSKQKTMARQTEARREAHQERMQKDAQQH